MRSPAKESFLRDIARVRGGDNDYVIAATLDVDALRACQSRAKRWPENGDSFKPVPEGFKLNKDRQKLPPKQTKGGAKIDNPVYLIRTVKLTAPLNDGFGRIVLGHIPRCTTA